MQADTNQAIPGLEDYWQWDRLLAECETLEGLSDDNRTRAKAAIQVLRRELGDDFLSEHSTHWHPFLDRIPNVAPWTRKWLAWLGETLDHACRQWNYSSLIARIKDPSKFAEALSVLEVYAQLTGAGFDVSFDPTFVVKGRGKKPDLLAVNPEGHDAVCVEVTDMQGAVTTKASANTSQSMIDTLVIQHPDLQFSGAIHKPLAQRHLDEVLNHVNTMLYVAEMRGEFQEVSFPGVLELAVAPDDHVSTLTDWAQGHGLALGELIGPPVELDETTRIKGRMREKCLQVPDDGTGVIVIRNSQLLFEGKSASALVSELEEGVYDCPNIIAAVVICGWLGPGQNAVARFSENAVIQTVRFDVFGDSAFFLYNRFHQTPSSPRTHQMIRQAFGAA